MSLTTRGVDQSLLVLPRFLRAAGPRERKIVSGDAMVAAASAFSSVAFSCSRGSAEFGRRHRPFRSR